MSLIYDIVVATMNPRRGATTITLFILVVVGLVATTSSVHAFSPLLPATTNTYSLCTSSGLSMVGGKGWDNNDYLENLGGTDEDREEETKSYQEFSEARAEFLERNQERMNSPQAKAFMEQHQRQQMKREQAEWSGGNDGDDWMNVPKSSQGGSRFGRMMAQSKARGGRGPAGPPGLGLEQKFAVPLDDEDDVNNN